MSDCNIWILSWTSEFYLYSIWPVYTLYTGNAFSLCCRSTHINIYHTNTCVFPHSQESISVCLCICLYTHRHKRTWMCVCVCIHTLPGWISWLPWCQSAGGSVSGCRGRGLLLTGPHRERESHLCRNMNKHWWSVPAIRHSQTKTHKVFTKCFQRC